jgi:hypothetical protein
VSRFAFLSLLTVSLHTGLAVAIPPPPSLARVTETKLLGRVSALAREQEGAPTNVYVGALATRSEALFVVSEPFSRPLFWIAWRKLGQPSRLSPRGDGPTVVGPVPTRSSAT